MQGGSLLGEPIYHFLELSRGVIIIRRRCLRDSNSGFRGEEKGKRYLVWNFAVLKNK